MSFTGSGFGFAENVVYSPPTSPRAVFSPASPAYSPSSPAFDDNAEGDSLISQMWGTGGVTNNKIVKLYNPDDPNSEAEAEAEPYDPASPDYAPDYSALLKRPASPSLSPSQTKRPQLDFGFGFDE